MHNLLCHLRGKHGRGDTQTSHHALIVINVINARLSMHYFSAVINRTAQRVCADRDHRTH